MEVRLANTPITDLDPSLTRVVLYDRLAHILNNNAIDELGILPFLPEPESAEASLQEGITKYPFIVQEQGTKLGIPIFCWVPLIDISYEILKDALRPAHSRATTETESETGAQEWWRDQVKCRKIMDATLCLLILSPDSFMAVNARKRLVQEGLLDPQAEVRFLDMALTFPRNCKSSGAWHHRKWLLLHMHKDHATVPIEPSVIEVHLQACHMAAERYPKCYYAWSMRHWLVEQLGRHWWKASLSSPASLDLDRMRPLEQEFERMKEHMQRNVSDYSTQQHVQQCMIQLGGRWVVQRLHGKDQLSSSRPEIVIQWNREELKRRQQASERWCRERLERHQDCKEQSRRIYTSAVRDAMQSTSTGISPVRGSFSWVARMWVAELERTRDLIGRYPGHESLWYHLRFVYYGLSWLDCETDALEECWIQEDVVDQQGAFASPKTEATYVDQVMDQVMAQSTIAQANADAVEKQTRFATNYCSWVERLDSVDQINVTNVG